MKTFKQSLNEATRPYQPKVVDPALMTFSEYATLVNPSGKIHPPAYDMDVERMNKARGISTDPKDWQNLVQQFTKNGLQFELRESVEDRWKWKLSKRLPDDSDYVRDENGMVQSMTPEEVQAMYPDEKRYRYEHAIFDKTNNVMVANTQDEWGALLVMVAREYRNFGFGTMLVAVHRERYPDRASGGFTSSGLENFRRVHAGMVRKYLESGMYSHLVRTGVITKERAKEIIGSIDRTTRKHTERNLSVDDPKDWLLLADESRAILYHKGFYTFDHDSDDGYWSERFILGYVTIGGNMDNEFIFRLFGRSEKIKSFMLEVMLNTGVGESIAMNPGERDLLKRLGDTLKTAEYPRSPRPSEDERLCWIEKPTMNLRAFAVQEQSVRKQHDKYDEYLNRLEEMADSIARDEQ